MRLSVLECQEFKYTSSLFVRFYLACSRPN